MYVRISRIGSISTFKFPFKWPKNDSKVINHERRNCWTIWLKIRELRIECNLFQPELSHRIGVSQITVCNLESADTKIIDFLLIDQICTAFQVDFYYFIKDRKANSIMINEEQKINDSNKLSQTIIWKV